MARPELAVPMRVPLVADPVLGPEVKWDGRASAEGVDAIVLPLRDERGLGRVTFENLDALRVARGEHSPYARTDKFEHWQWVYVIENSRWLEERHRYEEAHYETPLIESHSHYLFEFHDEFVEAIARGIWLDRPEEARRFAAPDVHPLLELPVEIAAERTESFGISWELRTNPTPVDQLVEASRLCSQRLFQYNLLLDGSNHEHATVWLRTRRDVSVSSFVTGVFGGTRIEVPGIAGASTFLAEYEKVVAGVAQRRSAKGLS